MSSSATMRRMISDTVVARSARNGAKKDDRMAFCMVFGHFLAERQPNCCRVFFERVVRYYGLSLSVGLLHAVARASSYGLKSLKKLGAGAAHGRRTY